VTFLELDLDIAIRRAITPLLWVMLMPLIDTADVVGERFDRPRMILRIFLHLGELIGAF
jgi:cobalamin-dependent methionine synthase I